ncbi:docking domain of Afi1 for Arf3 in vesicle trafficking-domain-containing protein [Microdochium trichocladiopsis]|uniref:Docking domain of Afi1 for Arf3 in vesicle trafficking-domain-containing protein n=1 Tax=Microdochium trichocladiopsis TaxID=1682393 RepID=A0A9P8YCF6_9PEZI|nr:docking domain of Afi1 for Arf3 in vesicle trafficking-domain-containing protein [Microdochium trichocladiopsis]KAH7038191.1 docking domain of Afi1 for Arf3 in vesicle trafficking-domain-containing protein [Microdochium trichocladiopsis]
MSTASRPSRSPQPPANRPADLSAYTSAYNTRNPMGSSSAATAATAGAGAGWSASQNHAAKQHARSPRRLRSQYPRSSIENHVEYILVASFDIDRGPVMEHQYPVAITGDEHMLAELMLPDQAHARNQDWTIFFLHKDTSQEEDEEEQKEKEARRRRRKRRRDRAMGILPAEGEEDEDDGYPDDDDDDDDDDDWSDDGSTASEPEGGEGPPLIYVLNLVNTKHDKTVKRGAIVKTMAICTRHPFLHIYKPLLLLALEEYFKAPVPETLAMLYEAVNSMDLSLMPKLSLLERNLLQASDNKDLFVEKFEQIIQRRMNRGPTLTERGSPEVPKGAPRRPAIQRAGTKAHLEGHSEFAVPRDTHEFESKVMYKGIPIPVKVPTAIMPETVGDFSLVKLIQQFSEPHTKAPQPFNTHPHLTTNGPLTHPIIVLANALLTQKRIIFLGHNMPSGEVAEAVLAACALASGGVLRGFTRHAFPYTDLTKIDDLLKVPGFIAGVTNPTFEMHPEWWDLLCDLPSGRMKISNRLEPLPPTEGLVYFQQQNPAAAALINGPSTGDLTSDTVFMNDILRSIATRQGERVIRAKWRDWVVKFARMSAAFEESVYGASALYIGGDEADANTLGKGGHGYVWPDESSKQKELAGNVHRIEGWRNTRSYYSFIQDLAQIYTIRPLKGLDLHHLHDRLRTQRLSPAQSREIYLSFANNVVTYDEICLLLTVAPESHGGLFYLALGLLHKDRDVRIATADLLERISEHEAGQHWWKGLSRFEKLAYQRIRRDAEGGGGGAEQLQGGLGGGGGYMISESDKRVS